MSCMKRLALLILFLPALITGSPSVYSQIAQYDLSVRILPDARRLEVTGTMRLPPVAEEKSQIEFYLSPKMDKPTVQMLEPKVSAPLTLVSSQEEGGDTKWVFKTTNPIPAGQSVLLQFSYSSDNKQAPQFIISPEGSFAGGGGELWYPQTAFKNRETGTLRFQVPAGEIAIANGELQSTEMQRAKGEFVFRVTKPVKFAFAAGKYKVFRPAGKIPFTLYLLKPRPHSQSLADRCAKALKLLTSLFGDFPYPALALVEVDFRSRVAGTSEFGFILADKSEFDVENLSYWAHEIGHQWWGNIVRSKSDTTGQMMLSEGVAQFGALLAIESIEGAQAAEDFRRHGYRGFRKFQSAAGYFELVSSGKDFPLTLYKPKDQAEILLMHRLANSKGFMLMDMLSRRIGREKFAAILKHFIRDNAGQLTSWQAFQQTVEARAGQQNIHWFFEQWFDRVGAPGYELTWQQEGRNVRGAITQPAPYFRATLEIEIIGSGRRLLKTVEAIGGRTEFNWTMAFRVDSVILDPHYKVLRRLPEFSSQPTR